MQRLARKSGICFYVLCAALLFAAPLSLLASDVVFSTGKLKIVEADGSEHVFTIELADTNAEREQGLMYRPEMADDHGMLFDFGTTRDVMMWMKDTKLSLDMLFMTSDYTIVTIAQNAVPYSENIISSKVPVAYVLEVNVGTVERLGIKVGDHIDRIQ